MIQTALAPLAAERQDLRPTTTEALLLSSEITGERDDF